MHSTSAWTPDLERMFNLNVDICNCCCGHAKLIACIEAPVVIEKSLLHLERRDSTMIMHSPPSRDTPRGRLFG